MKITMFDTLTTLALLSISLVWVLLIFDTEMVTLAVDHATLWLESRLSRPLNEE